VQFSSSRSRMCRGIRCVRAVGRRGFVVLLMEVSISYTDASYTVKYYIRRVLYASRIRLVGRLSGPTHEPPGNLATRPRPARRQL